MTNIINDVSIKGLRKVHFSQLIQYLDTRDRENWYYGNKEQFQNRHDELYNWIENIIETLSQDGVKVSKNKEK